MCVKTYYANLLFIIKQFLFLFCYQKKKKIIRRNLKQYTTLFISMVKRHSTPLLRDNHLLCTNIQHNFKLFIENGNF